jgi:hypothetical protein
MTSKLQLSLDSNFSDVPWVDIRSELPVNPNYTWAQLAGTRPLSALNTIICHHDAIPKYKTVQYTDITLAKRIATDHIRSTKNHPGGDAGFPYDLWIRNGIIYWCNDVEAREYGVASNNGYTVNISVSGDYKNGDVLTPEDRRALYAAIISMKNYLTHDQHLKGHNELQATSCPGYDMNQVREEVFALEQKIEQANSPKKKEEIAWRIVNQTMFLYNMSKGKTSTGGQATEKQINWAAAELLKFEPEFRRLGWLE